MTDADDSAAKPQRKRDIAAKWIATGLTEGEQYLKRAAGLGATPNVVPVGVPDLYGEPRSVHVGWHPVAGIAGDWFAKSTGIGKLITEKINSYPDPTQHWAVLVGEYAHQLWMDENFDVIYTNAKVNPEEWQTFPVGTTRFNDDAMRRAGEAVIQQIRDKQPGYNLITNNCQTYALRLLDAIKADGANHFPTTATVYQTIIGPGKVVDLFKPMDGTAPAEDTVSAAQSAMQQHTNQLDTHGPAFDPSNPNDQLQAGTQPLQGYPTSSPGYPAGALGALNAAASPPPQNYGQQQGYPGQQGYSQPQGYQQEQAIAQQQGYQQQQGSPAQQADPVGQDMAERGQGEGAAAVAGETGEDGAGANEANEEAKKKGGLLKRLFGKKK